MSDNKPARPGAFIAMRVANYRRYFFGQGVSMVGTWMQQVAQSWLVLTLTHSGTVLGIVVAVQTLPILFLGPYMGLLADRHSKRHLLIITNAAMGVLGLILGLLVFAGVVQLWMVLVLALLLGLMNALGNPTQQAFVLEMVGHEKVRSAVSLNSVLVNAARAVGPAIAGVLIAFVGVGACFIVDAVSYTVVLAALALMNTGELLPSIPAKRTAGQLRDGLRYVIGVPTLIIPLCMMFVIGTLAYEFRVTLPLLAESTFHGGADTFGLLTSAQGAGAVLGGLWVARFGTTGIRAIVLTALGFGAAIAVASVTPSITTTVIALAVVGATSVQFLSTGNSTLQLSSDPQFRGRVMSLWSVAFLGTTPIGGPVAGWVSESYGARWGLGMGAVACVLAALLGCTAVYWRRRKRRSQAGQRPGYTERCAGVVQRQNISFPS